MFVAADSNRLGRIGWAIVLAALCMRLCYDFVAQINEPLRADSGQYFTIALNVLKHATYSTADPESASVVADSYRAPGYPTIIATMIWLFGGMGRAFLAMLVLQSLMGAAVVALTIKLTLRMLPRQYAYAAGMLCAVWPHLITLGGYALTETTFGYLVCLSAFMLVEARDNPTLSRSAMAGLSLAAAALVNPVILGFLLPVAVWMCATRRSRAAVLFALLALAPPMLWAIRDAHIQTAPRMSSGGRLIENVLIGAEPNFIPRYKDYANEKAAVAARQWIEHERDVFAASPRDAFLDVWDRISSRPGFYFLWYLSKPAQFWTWSIVQGNGDVYEYPMLVAPFDSVLPLRVIAAVCHGINTPLMWASFAGVMLFLLMRKRLADTQRTAAGMVTAVFVYATAIHTILTPDARYATPFRPFEFILATMVACYLIEQWRHYRDGKRVGEADSRLPPAQLKAP
jgi:4-amino-4-deoxy-L-arabinose transferase-like glycosyltransferase